MEEEVEWISHFTIHGIIQRQQEVFDYEMMFELPGIYLLCYSV
jgi:hypothetical protein